jgi:hypothetical protein
LSCDLCNQGKITTSGLSVPVGNDSCITVTWMY